MLGLSRRLINCFIISLVFLYQQQIIAQTKQLNLYILEFDNLRSDPSVIWLSTGFVDMLRKDFSEVESVRIFGRQELEAVLQDKSVILRQPWGTKNVLIMGSYVRDLDQLTVDVQLINIANWEEVAKVTAIGLVKRIPSLSNDLFQRITNALVGYIPPPPRPGVLQEPRGLAEIPAYRQQVKELSFSIPSAMKELEESMDLYIGAREKVEEEMEPGHKFVRKFSFGESSVATPISNEEAVLLENIVNMISRNPYRVEILEPILEVMNEKEKRVKLNLPIKFSLRENFIKDLLTSLPYTGLRQDGTLTTLEFSKKKFPVTSRLSDKISRGEFRVVPVIQLSDKNDQIRTVILDTSDPFWYTKSSDKVKFLTQNKFSPLLVFTVGGWSLQVTMESVEIDVNYQFELPRQEVINYSKVTVEFVPESELSQFLGSIL